MNPVEKAKLAELALAAELSTMTAEEALVYLSGDGARSRVRPAVVASCISVVKKALAASAKEDAKQLPTEAKEVEEAVAAEEGANVEPDPVEAESPPASPSPSPAPEADTLTPAEQAAAKRAAYEAAVAKERAAKMGR